jgi:putative flippase GtrA
LTDQLEILLRNTRLARQFLKFAVVGTIGAVVDFGLLAILKELVHLNLYVANTFSFSAAVLNNYTLNTFWTFGDQENRRPAQQLAQFFLVSIVGLGINQALLYVFHDIVGLWYMLAKAIATVVVLGWNFTANKLWTFRGA